MMLLIIQRVYLRHPGKVAVGVKMHCFWELNIRTAPAACQLITYYVISEHHTDCVWLTKAYELNAYQPKLRVSRTIYVV